MLWFIALIGCNPNPESAPPPPPVPPGDPCASIDTPLGTVDCTTVERCGPFVQEIWDGCAVCDWERFGTCPDEAKGFPPDTGPVVEFSRAFTTRLRTSFSPTQAYDLHIAPTTNGLLLTPQSRASRAIELPCTRTGNTLSCDRRSIDIGFDQVEYLLFELRLEDQSGDGVADSGWVRTEVMSVSTAYTPEPFPSYEPLLPDHSPGVARFSPRLLPTDPIIIELSEPVRGAPASVNGQWSLEVLSGPDNTILGLRTDGAPLPWGSEVTLPERLFDLSGNLMEVLPGQVPPFPGPLSENPSFAEPTGGWATQDVVLGPYPSFPGGDDGIAYFSSSGSLVGQIDLEPDATTVSFAYASIDSSLPWSATLTLTDALGRSTELWSLGTPTDWGCPGQDMCIPWTDVRADIGPWAGSTVWLRWQVGYSEPRPYEIPRYLWTIPPSTSTRIAIDEVTIE